MKSAKTISWFIKSAPSRGVCMATWYARWRFPLGIKQCEAWRVKPLHDQSWLQSLLIHVQYVRDNGTSVYRNTSGRGWLEDLNKLVPELFSKKFVFYRLWHHGGLVKYSDLSSLCSVILGDLPYNGKIIALIICRTWRLNLLYLY